MFSAYNKKRSRRNTEREFFYELYPTKKSRRWEKKKEITYNNLATYILRIVENHTAGIPTNEKVKWTDLRPTEIKNVLYEHYQIRCSNQTIKRILKANGYVKRKPTKSLAIGNSPNRAEQFRIICLLISLFEDMEHNPIISIDTKKKESLGQLTRKEPLLMKKGEKVSVFSSDYPFLATGRAIPHGIYDKKMDQGYLSIGNSKETADFIIDNLRWWWKDFGRLQYERATHILILCDGGGANGHRHHRFKVLLQQFSREIGRKIVIAHYPPYCSKYNPIERKLFSHVHRTIQNTILTDLQQVKELMMKTKHEKGLSVQVRIVEKDYALKQPSFKEDIDEKRILRHPTLPQYSYTILS